MTRVVKGHDGKLRTEASPEPVDLAKARRECLDRIQGNEQFHTDPFAAPPQAELDIPLLFCTCALDGRECDFCREADDA